MGPIPPPDIKCCGIRRMLLKHLANHTMASFAPAESDEGNSPMHFEERLVRVQPGRAMELRLRKLECLAFEKIDAELIAVVPKMATGSKKLFAHDEAIALSSVPLDSHALQPPHPL